MDSATYTIPAIPGVVFFVHRGPSGDNPDLPPNWLQTTGIVEDGVDGAGNTMYAVVFSQGGSGPQ